MRDFIRVGAAAVGAAAIVLFGAWVSGFDYQRGPDALFVYFLTVAFSIGAAGCVYGGNRR